MTILSELEKAADISQAKEILSFKVKELFETYKNPDSIYFGKKICKLQAGLNKIDTFSWLFSQTAEIKTFWSDRNHEMTITGIGAAHKIKCSHGDEVQKALRTISEDLKNSSSHVRYYGGFRFDSREEFINKDVEWDIFGQLCFVCSRFELINQSDNDNSILAVNVNLATDNMDQIFSEIEKIDVLHEFNREMPQIVSRMDAPDKEEWKTAIETALEAFEHHQLEKVVLARKSIIGFSGFINPITILKRLSEDATGCFNFLFQFDTRHTFLGATPERLYFREKQKIFTEAVAGTRSRGFDLQHDETLGRELLGTEKEIREHRFVVNSIKESLKKLCDDVKNGSEITLLKLAKVQHLMSKFEGVLKPNITDADILEILHPTPAVGGVPTDTAFDMIQNLEPFDRGWYAGPVGWIERDAAEFVVAIRSGLIDENCLILYSGAGIVNGSQADEEWREIENKLGNFIKAISKS